MPISSPGLTVSPFWPNPQSNPLRVSATLTQVPQAAAIPDYVAATNAAAVQTYASSAGKVHSLQAIGWSYNASPANASLTVADGASTVFSVDLVTAGPGTITFSPPLAGTSGNAMTVTLSNGGVGVTGKVTIEGHALA